MMWATQIQSAMTRRCDVAVKAEKHIRIESRASALAKKAEMSKHVHEAVYQYLKTCPASSASVARAINKCESWTRKILKAMKEAGRVTCTRTSYAKIWRAI